MQANLDLLMDEIHICDLEIWCHVGVPDAERAKEQRLLISVGMDHDVSRAARMDDLEATVDYDAVSRRVIRFVQGRPWRLIETLASDLAQLILAEFKPAAVTLEVKKFIIPEARYVSVRVRRERVE